MQGQETFKNSFMIHRDDSTLILYITKELVNQYRDFNKTW